MYYVEGLLAVSAVHYKSLVVIIVTVIVTSSCERIDMTENNQSSIFHPIRTSFVSDTFSAKFALKTIACSRSL